MGWDNPKTVVKEIKKGRKRVINEKYQALVSHFNFEPLFCLPARGNEKPHVENRVKFLQRNWATPIPRVSDLDELNRHLFKCCVEDQQRIVSGQSDSIAERFSHERKNALPLPERPFDAAVVHEREVDKYQTVAFDTCRYSVPRRYAFQKAKVKAYVDRIAIVVNGSVIAKHDRSYEARSHVLDPLHYLETLQRKPACLNHTGVYQNWKLPAEFGELLHYFEDRHGSMPGARQYIRVLQLLATHSIDHVQRALRACQAEGVVTAERIIFRCERLTPARQRRLVETDLDQEVVVHSVPAVQVPLPNLNKFDFFLPQGGDKNDRTRRSASAEDEFKTASFADDAGGVHQAGS